MIDMRWLTVRQPWATALVTGAKDVENRGWCPTYRGWVLIHAGKITDTAPSWYTPPEDLPNGVIIGAVWLDDIRTDSESRWAEPRHYHWLITKPIALPPDLRVEHRGEVGLRQVSQELFDRLPAGFRRALHF